MQMKHEMTRIVKFYQSQMRKEKTKREGINRVQPGQEVTRRESVRLDDKEVTGVRSGQANGWENGVGLRSQE